MISHIDHVVLTARDIERAVAFYTRVLAMEAETFAGGRRALKFGNQKINLQTSAHISQSIVGGTETNLPTGQKRRAERIGNTVKRLDAACRQIRPRPSGRFRKSARGRRSPQP